MTCIVGIETGTSVLLGGDSAIVGGWTLTRTVEPKVFGLDTHLIIGCTGAPRIGQLLRWTLKTPPDEYGGRSPDRYISGPFMDALRKCLSAGGVLKKENEQEAANESSLLVGYWDALYWIGPSLGAIRQSERYMAIGSGDDLALGSLHTSARLSVHSPRERTLFALEAAAEHNLGVTGPFTFVETK